MLSPAQPSPSRSGKKLQHFLLRFSPKILKDYEIMLFQNRKNKIVGSTRFSMKINVFWWFFVANWTSKNQHAGLAMVTKARFAPWLLDDFFMFFACFLTHCKTGVLIFWRSIWMKNHVIFACFSRAFWSIARPGCWFFDGQYRRKIVLFSCVFRVLSDRLQDRRVDFFVLRGASGSSTLRTTWNAGLRNSDCVALGAKTL